MGFLQKLFRANSKNLAGWVEGSITQLKSGMRQVSVENGKVVLWIVGKDDIIIDPSQIKSLELATSNITKQYGNNIMICDAYILVLKNGESGTLTIFKGKIADVLLALKK